MKQGKKIFSGIAVFFIVFSFLSCREELRGEVEKSTDGKTYLVFEDIGGCDCDSLYVNGVIWRHGWEKGEVTPGTCLVGCGPDRIDYMGINIKKGTTFHFDYWGP